MYEKEKKNASKNIARFSANLTPCEILEAYLSASVPVTNLRALEYAMRGVAGWHIRQ